MKSLRGKHRGGFYTNFGAFRRKLKQQWYHKAISNLNLKRCQSIIRSNLSQSLWNLKCDWRNFISRSNMWLLQRKRKMEEQRNQERDFILIYLIWVNVLLWPKLFCSIRSLPKAEGEIPDRRVQPHMIGSSQEILLGKSVLCHLLVLWPLLRNITSVLSISLPTSDQVQNKHVRVRTLLYLMLALVPWEFDFTWNCNCITIQIEHNSSPNYAKTKIWKTKKRKN